MNKKTLPFKTGKITVIKKAFWNNPIEVSEETIQKQVVAYCRMKNIEVTPSLNGIKMTAGMANKYKSLGMEKGVADLHFHDSNDKYHCLYIELKKKGGKVSPEQKAFIERRNKDGKRALVCYGYDEAIAEINEYFNMHVCGKEITI